MNKKITLLLIAFLFSTVLMAQEQLTISQQEVQQTVIKMFDALSNRDSSSLKIIALKILPCMNMARYGI